MADGARAAEPDGTDARGIGARTEPDVAAVCEAFGLGRAVAPLSPVAGGLTNRVWRLETDRGAFAIKAYRAEALAQRAWLERAYTIEVAARAGGVAAPPPVEAAGGGWLATVPEGDGAATVRAHVWADGEALRRAVYGEDVARSVAGIIARLHALRLPAGLTAGEALRPRGADYWERLAGEVERSRASWRWEFRAMLPVLDGLEGYAEAAAGRLGDEALILSHRDADQKNWIKGRGGLVLVDWDAAGPVHARQEAASLALTWAGVHLGEPDWRVVRAWIDGYRRAGGDAGRFREGDLAEFVVVMAGWFGDSALRAVRRAGTSDDDGGDERLLRRLFAELNRVQRSVQRWERVLAAE